CLHRRDGALVDVRRWLYRGILQNLTLRGGVQHVGVDRERRLAALVLGGGDLVRVGERDELLAALEGPLAPGGDDPDGGFERVIRQLEADLVVALACRAVADGGGAGRAGGGD